MDNESANVCDCDAECCSLSSRVDEAFGLDVRADKVLNCVVLRSVLRQKTRGTKGERKDKPRGEKHNGLW